VKSIGKNQNLLLQIAAKRVVAAISATFRVVHAVNHQQVKEIMLNHEIFDQLYIKIV